MEDVPQFGFKKVRHEPVGTIVMPPPPPASERLKARGISIGKTALVVIGAIAATVGASFVLPSPVRFQAGLGIGFCAFMLWQVWR